jgi:hypothetical protein
MNTAMRLTVNQPKAVKRIGSCMPVTPAFFPPLGWRRAPQPQPCRPDSCAG